MGKNKKTNDVHTQVCVWACAKQQQLCCFPLHALHSYKMHQYTWARCTQIWRNFKERKTHLPSRSNGVLRRFTHCITENGICRFIIHISPQSCSMYIRKCVMILLYMLHYMALHLGRVVLCGGVGVLCQHVCLLYGHYVQPHTYCACVRALQVIKS